MGVSFDTVDDLITCGTSDTLLTENGSITISLWLFPTTDTTGGGDPRLVSRSNATGQVYWGIQATSSVYLQCVGAVASLNVFSTNNTITLNTWQNLVITWTGTTATSGVHIYKNNVETSYLTGVAGNTPIDNSGSTFIIGNTSAGTRPVGGYISELAIWSTVLNSADRTAVATARRRGIPFRTSTSTLVSYWPLEDVARGVSGNLQTFRDAWGTNTGTGSNGTNGTGCTGTTGEPISYLFQDDKSAPRGIFRGVLAGGI